MSSEQASARFPDARGHSASPAEAGRRWFVLRTRSRQEKALATDLHAMAVELPVADRTRRVARAVEAAGVEV